MFTYAAILDLSLKFLDVAIDDMDLGKDRVTETSRDKCEKLLIHSFSNKYY